MFHPTLLSMAVYVAKFLNPNYFDHDFELNDSLAGYNILGSKSFP